jgi:CO/xanthine dehydrogenase FAD-binding subunit
MRPDSAQYVRPTELSAALATLAAAPRVVLAGGTDLYATGVPMPDRLRQAILDITAIKRLRSIRSDEAEVTIGATATWAEVRDSKLLPTWFRALKQSAAQVGGEQVQNVGTVAGNLCNASPAADGVPPLLALSARIDLASTRGVRTVALEDFVLGSRRTACAADELVTAIRIPLRSRHARSVFHKLGARAYLVISIVSLAVTLDFDAADRISYAGVAVGSCSVCARRVRSIESQLLGLDRAAACALSVPKVIAELAPIDDIRGSAAYRRDAVAVLVPRAVRELCDG